jgi:hypothetical protein
MAAERVGAVRTQQADPLGEAFETAESIGC